MASLGKAVELNALENSAGPSSVQLDSASDAKDNTLTPELFNKVFKNDMLRDRIFDYVFSCGSSGEVKLTKDILTCRAVDHAWLDYVTDRLQKSHNPVLTLDFKYWKKSKYFLNRQEKGYQVEKFLNTWANPRGAGRRIPLFNLKFQPGDDCVVEGRLQALVKCLKRCGSGLYDLLLNLDGLAYWDSEYDDGECGLSVFEIDVNTIGQLHLPNLTSLQVILPNGAEDKPFITSLLSRILSGCKRLKFLLVQESEEEDNPWSKLFSEGESISAETEKMPNTLREIKFDLGMTTQLLEKILLENSLPNLTKLTLSNDNGVTNDVLVRIIARYSLQLDYFCLVGIPLRKRKDLLSTGLKFPEMAKLKHMLIKRLHSEAESDNEQCLPVLETLKLEDQTLSMMQKWTLNSPFNSVKDLTVIMLKPSKGIFTQKLSVQLHVAFPYVQKLDINFGYCLLEDGCIRKIFQHMTQLGELLIRLDNTGGGMGTSTWDAILLGVTPEYAKTITETPQEEWDSTNLDIHRTPSHSIVNLSRLTTLLLQSYEPQMDDLISDISFHFAFLRMPNLHKLTLHGKFRASKEMVQEWERRGREFNQNVRVKYFCESTSGSDEEQEV